MKVKICGQTSVSDSLLSIQYGADYVGVVVDVKWSPRSLSIQAARPIFDSFRERAFLLTFDMPAAPSLADAVELLDPYAIQLTGHESYGTVSSIKKRTNRPVFKSIHLAPANDGKILDTEAILKLMDGYVKAGVAGFVLDTASNGIFGGTGVKNDWILAGKISVAAPAPVFLAGGINPENVAEALSVPGIYGIDLASGVESKKGIKSEEKIKALFDAIGKVSA